VASHAVLFDTPFMTIGSILVKDIWNYYA